MEHTNFFIAFWWLIFPIMGFGMGALRNWLRYSRQRDAMEVLKTYVANGREPPPEVLAALNVRFDDVDGAWGPNGRMGRFGMWFPGLIMFAFAGAFGYATTLSRYADNQGLHFVVVLFLLLGCAFVAAHFIGQRVRRPASTDGRIDGR